MKKKAIGTLILLLLWASVHGAFAYTWWVLEGKAYIEVVTPYVQWYNWKTNKTEPRFDLTIPIASEQLSTINNASCGIINRKTTGPQNCTFFVESINITKMGERPANFTVQIYNATHTKATWTTTDWMNLGDGEGNEEPFTMYAKEKASVRIIVLASAYAVACNVVFKLHVPPEGT